MYLEVIWLNEGAAWVHMYPEREKCKAVPSQGTSMTSYLQQDPLAGPAQFWFATVNGGVIIIILDQTNQFSFCIV